MVRAVAQPTVGVTAPGIDTVVRLHADVARETRRLHVLHAKLECRRGCSSCCVDGLSVFDVEAAHIQRNNAGLLAMGIPHAEGACAFLDELGACRIYADRPYVCRTQGLPLRWLEAREGGSVELRDICPLNAALEPIEELPEEACWSIGPVEERLAQLQLAGGAGARAGSTGPLPPCESVGAHRTRLRDLFLSPSVDKPLIRGE
jgi:Fe-S-cluster containining protein